MIKQILFILFSISLSIISSSTLYGQVLPEKAKQQIDKIEISGTPGDVGAHGDHNHDRHNHSGHSHDGHNHGTQSSDGHNHDHSHGNEHGTHNHNHLHQGQVKENHNHQDGHDHSHGAHKGAAHQKDHSHAAGSAHHEDDHHGPSCDHAHGHHGEFDPGATAFHHISDANVYSIGPWNFPLPCFLYSKEQGFDVFLSNKFKFDFMGHGEGHQAYNRYFLDGGRVKRVVDSNFPMGEVKIDGVVHDDESHAFVCYQGKMWNADAPSTADAGLFGGGITSFFDFSITKNVLSMIIVFFLLAWMFISMAKSYVTRKGMAPKGIQSFLEPIFVFIQDEVSKPFLGEKYMKYQPFLMALFFFILGLNLWGQVPFFGGSNVTGNLAVTMVLAIFAFFVVNLSGNKNYWEHIFAMPGVPKWVLTILSPVEFMGVFIKPLTLMLRLFANITAGHMVIVIFVSLIFVFSKNGASPVGGYGTVIPSALLTLFMMSIELLVAFIQAFVFTILTAAYIGAAVEEAHH